MGWKGPLEDGVSQSLLNKFLQCPYRFYLYAILGLRPPGPPNENLIWGDCYHVGLEHYLPTSWNEARDAMIARLATYPTAPSTYAATLQRMLRLYEKPSGTWQTEVVFDRIEQVGQHKVRLRGKLDGICYDHPEFQPLMIEHKCKGYIDPEQVRREISQDLQCNLYMYLHDIEWVQYDLILIPESQKYAPKQSPYESTEDYINKIFTGPCGNYQKYPINRNKHQWISQEQYLLSRESQEEYWEATIVPIIDRLVRYYDYVTRPGFDPNNPEWYNHLFYKMPVRHFNGSNTEKFQCEYYEYLIGEMDLEDLEPVGGYFTELEEE